METPHLKNGFIVSIVIGANVLGTPLDGTLLREAEFLNMARFFANPALVFVCLHFEGLVCTSSHRRCMGDWWERTT